MKNIENVTTYMNGVHELNNATDSVNKSYFLYIKSLSQILVGLLGLLIGLKSNVQIDHIPKVLFLLSLTLIGLTILFAQKLLFYEVVIRENEAKAYLILLEKLRTSSQKEDLIIEVSQKPKFFSLFEKLTFCCFVLSIISLISYSVFLYFPLCSH